MRAIRAPDFDFMPLADGQRLDAGNVVVDVLHTPGHTRTASACWCAT